MASQENNTGQPAARPRRRRRPVTVWSVLGAIFGTLFKVLGTLLLVGICTGAILACYAVVYVQTIIIPQTEQVLASIDLFTVNQSSSMFYTDKNTGAQVEMVTLFEEDRVWVEYEEIPEDLINATIAIEDKRFRKHQGVDWIRTAAGMVYMFTGREIQGGSTITQQLIKNLTQYDDVTVKRKILEIFTALEFEKRHSKDEILEWYLNYIFLGDRCYGVYAAAQNYYGKELDQLTLAECASIISITQNPSLRHPYRNPEGNLQRRNLTLELMADPEQGFITQEECDAAKAEPLNLKRESGTYREQEIYTWYEDQVIKDVIADLRDKFGLTEDAATTLIYRGGLRIETCFDPQVQAHVDAIYTDRAVLELDSANGQEIQSGITVIDNATGNVVALSGGIGEKDSSRSWSRATDTVRPPGSSIKPLAVYAPALDMGLVTPATVFDDTPIDLNGDAWPRNSYNYFKGLTTVHEAVEDSVNTIAVKVLRDLVTPNASYQFMEERFGITSLVPYVESNGQVFSDYDLAPLALGGLTEGVSTYEMAAAYATFANNGMYKAPRTYLRVTAVDTNGVETVLLENSSASEAVLKESTVYYMNAMLENVIDAGTGRTANFEGMTIAGKTGTTTSNNDKWFVGYSPYYTAAVWVGYDIMERIPSTGYLAADLWKQVMEPLHAELEDVPFQAPDDLVTQYYCKDSGKIPTEFCSMDARGYRVVSGTFVDGDQPREYCTIHIAQEICMDSPILNANGEPTGMYYAYSQFCPEESKNTVGILDYQRLRVTESVATRDDYFLKSTLDAMDAGALLEGGDPLGSLCHVHTEPQEPVPFDPLDPSTWPADDPNFDPLDPSTWPSTEDPAFDINDPSTWPTDDPNFDPTDSSTWPGAAAEEPPGFNLLDPSTWPDDPNFNPLDPSTWPGNQTSSPPEESDPGADASPPPSEQTPPEETPPEDEPFVPADGSAD